MGYFQNFPNNYVYANTICIDITKRCRVMVSVRSNPFSYYPYTVKSGLRADTIADKYYSDEMRSWMVYTSMDIIDPYYEYPLSPEQFSQYITDKYGSVANAQNRINYWEINWSDDDGKLSLSGFNSLPDALKKYYNANYGIGASIISYSRRKADWLVSTNMIVTYGVDNDTPFQDKELVQVFTGNTVIGNAEVCWSNSSFLIVQNVQGDTPANTAQIRGLTSNAVANISQVIFTSNSIPIDERSFWEPVTFWDHELTIHQGRKYIKLIDNKYTTQMEYELNRLINDKPLLFNVV